MAEGNLGNEHEGALQLERLILFSWAVRCLHCRCTLQVAYTARQPFLPTLALAPTFMHALFPVFFPSKNLNPDHKSTMSSAAASSSRVLAPFLTPGCCCTAPGAFSWLTVPRSICISHSCAPSTCQKFCYDAYSITPAAHRLRDSAFQSDPTFMNSPQLLKHARAHVSNSVISHV